MSLSDAGEAQCEVGHLLCQCVPSTLCSLCCLVLLCTPETDALQDQSSLTDSHTAWTTEGEWGPPWILPVGHRGSESCCPLLNAHPSTNKEHLLLDLLV